MEPILILLFLTGYGAIAFEHVLKVNKAGTALCMGALCWTAYILCTGSGHVDDVLGQMNEELGSIANILFFLIGAMTIVEVVDAHDGFRVITESIHTRNKRKLLWTISLISFFLSAVLDNLTTTIVMMSLMAKLIGDRKDRLMFVSMIVIAANSGGAWSPMGDVTTTMLWIGKQVSTASIILWLFIPSVVSLLMPLAVISFFMKGKVSPPLESAEGRRQVMLPASVRNSVFFIGITILLCIPVFKAWTHLPPYVGMMLGVGILWLYTGILYRKHRGGRLKQHLSVTQALHKIEISTILFFLGILLCVGALQHAGILSQMAEWLDKSVGDQSVTVMIIGIISAIVDNVPLVAAAQGMYDFPTDHFFWKFLAYAAGTGGSMLIIGSAAGVAAMGQEKINFIWYLKHVSGWALLGYLAGAFTYILLH